MKAHEAVPHSGHVEGPGPEPDVQRRVTVAPECPGDSAFAVMPFVDRIEGE